MHRARARLLSVLLMVAPVAFAGAGCKKQPPEPAPPPGAAGASASGSGAAGAPAGEEKAKPEAKPQAGCKLPETISSEVTLVKERVLLGPRGGGPPPGDGFESAPIKEICNAIARELERSLPRRSGSKPSRDTAGMT